MKGDFLSRSTKLKKQIFKKFHAPFRNSIFESVVSWFHLHNNGDQLSISKTVIIKMNNNKRIITLNDVFITNATVEYVTV